MELIEVAEQNSIEMRSLSTITLSERSHGKVEKFQTLQVFGKKVSADYCRATRKRFSTSLGVWQVRARSARACAAGNVNPRTTALT